MAPKMRPPSERFWERVRKGGPDECWVWCGTTTYGYGAFSVRRKSFRAHRFAYEDTVGPIPSGLTIDHLCRNKLCVNPAHLEPVTALENIMRVPRATSCANGHPYNEANTAFYTNKREGWTQRVCRECSREKARRQYWAKKAVA